MDVAVNEKRLRMGRENIMMMMKKISALLLLLMFEILIEVQLLVARQEVGSDKFEGGRW